MGFRWPSPVSPTNGGCIDTGMDGWFETTWPCPEALRIGLTSYGLGTTISVNFNGRGKVGNLCGGSDSYVTVSPTGVVIDVWGALRAGVWLSSTTVLVYVQSGGTGDIFAAAGPSGLYGVVKTGVGADAAGCPTTLRATVTLNDDGSLSIA